MLGCVSSARRNMRNSRRETRCVIGLLGAGAMSDFLGLKFSVKLVYALHLLLMTSRSGSVNLVNAAWLATYFCAIVCNGSLSAHRRTDTGWRMKLLFICILLVRLTRSTYMCVHEAGLTDTQLHHLLLVEPNRHLTELGQVCKNASPLRRTTTDSAPHMTNNIDRFQTMKQHSREPSSVQLTPELVKRC